MEINIEITEREIAERKQQWIDAQVQKYMGLDYWEKSTTQDQLFAEIRKKHQYGAELYLTEEFKKELQNTVREQVQKLVDEELKISKQTLKHIVQNYLFEKLEVLVQETLKDAIFTTQNGGVDMEKDFLLADQFE